MACGVFSVVPSLAIISLCNHYMVFGGVFCVATSRVTISLISYIHVRIQRIPPGGPDNVF